MKLLYVIPLALLIAVGVWFGPVRAAKVRHHCNLVAASQANSTGYIQAYYNTLYTVCVRSH